MGAVQGSGGLGTKLGIYGGIDGTRTSRKGCEGARKD